MLVSFPKLFRCHRVRGPGGLRVPGFPVGGGDGGGGVGGGVGVGFEGPSFLILIHLSRICACRGFLSGRPASFSFSKTVAASPELYLANRRAPSGSPRVLCAYVFRREPLLRRHAVIAIVAASREPR